jgi:hypothetical protein
MDLVTALAIVIGVMGAIATWVAITMGSPYLLIWAVFIGWGSFYHCGGKEAGIKSSAVANVWGVICAAVALIVALALAGSLGLPLAAGLCVGISIVILILGAKVPALAAIPASVYGYASTAALFLHGAAAYGEGNTAVIKVAAAVAISLIVGNVLGFISEKIAGAVVKK